MTAKEAIEKRRSIRKYKADAVPDAAIAELIEAARLAPSGTNHQPWRFYVIRDPEVRGAIADVSFNQEHIYKAPVLFVCCADLTAYAHVNTRTRLQELIEVGASAEDSLDTYPALKMEDDKEAMMGYRSHAMLNVALAMENVALRAVELGLGTCIVQLTRSKKVAAILDLPETMVVTALMPVGYPDENPAPRPRLSAEEIAFYI